MSNIASPGTGSLNMLQRIEVLENENKQLKDANEFSFEERRIGTWIDGKPLYRKMIDFGELPSNGRKDFIYDIDNVAHVHVNLGVSFWYTKDNSLMNAGYKASNTFLYSEYISAVTAAGGNRIIIYTTSVKANNYKALICLEYTKTSD